MALVALFCLSSATVNGAEQAADAEAEMARADGYMAQRNYQAAIAHYNAARLLAPDRPGPYRGLGMAYYAAGQCADAVPVLEEYVRRKQRDPWPQAVRALADCKQRLAPSSPREERAPGTVRVTSDPPGAQVRIDDADGPLVGTTPFESSGLPPGSHRVFLTAPDFAPATGDVRIQPGVMPTLHIPLVPLPKPKAIGAITLKNDHELEQYEQSQALEQQIAEQVKLRYEGQKIEVCGAGPNYHFCTLHETLTENEFVRRYRKLTGAHDLDFAQKVRNKGAIGVWTTIGLVGVGLVAYGAATYSQGCVDSTGMAITTSGCSGTTNDTSSVIMWSGVTVWAISVLGYFVYGGLRFDGTPEEHVINEYDARLYTARYNRELERRIHNDLAAGRLSQWTDPARPRREIARRPWPILPYAGPSGIGLSGRF